MDIYCSESMIDTTPVALDEQINNEEEKHKPNAKAVRKNIHCTSLTLVQKVKEQKLVVTNKCCHNEIIRDLL